MLYDRKNRVDRLSCAFLELRSQVARFRSFNASVIKFAIFICPGKEKATAHCIERKGRKGERAKRATRDAETARNRGAEKVCGITTCVLILCGLIMDVKGSVSCM